MTRQSLRHLGRLPEPERANGRGAGVADLHARPPMTPTSVLRRHPGAVPLLLTAVVALGVLAGYDGGRLLLSVDRPVAEAAAEMRSPAWTRAMRAASAVGGMPGVVAGLGAAVVLVWRRCRTLAVALVVATALRPLAAVALKELVDRPRPDLDPLVVGHGSSFPSGHVLAAVALWGLLPPVVAVFSDRRWLWWASVVASGAVIAVVAVSRVYLGAHWPTDVVGSFLLGAIYLLAVDSFVARRHDQDGACRRPVADG